MSTGAVPIGWIRQLDGSYSPPPRAGKRMAPAPVPTSLQPVPVAQPYNKYQRSSAYARTANGIIFDSKLEMKAYLFLEQHHISYTRQPEFELQPSFELDGKVYRPVVYKGDFLIAGPKSDLLCDMKGMETPEFRLKLKLFTFKFRRPIFCLKSVAELEELLRKHGVLV